MKHKESNCNELHGKYVEKIEKELKHLKKTKVPRCVICKINFVNAIDSITKKKSKYLWKPNCKCFKEPIQISIG